MQGSVVMNSTLQRVQQLAPDVSFWSARLVESQGDELSLRQGVLQPLRSGTDCGLMLTVHTDHGYGYAATADLSDDGIRNAFAQAHSWAGVTAKHPLLNIKPETLPKSQGKYRSPVQ